MYSLGAYSAETLTVAPFGGESRLGILAIAAGVLTAVALLACAASIRRALRIEPTEALRHAG